MFKKRTPAPFFEHKTAISLFVRGSVVCSAFLLILNCGAKQKTYCVNPNETNCNVEQRRLEQEKLKNAVTNTNPAEVETIMTPASIVNSAVTAGDDISFTDITTTTMRLYWGAAQTNENTADLKYKIVKANAAESIDTIAKIESVTGDDLVQDYLPIDLHGEKLINNLIPATKYFFAILVKNEVGNIALYPPKSQSTLDISNQVIISPTPTPTPEQSPSPTPDASAPITGTTVTFSLIGTSSLTATWGAANDSLTPEASLQYKLVKADASTSIDTIAKADAIPAGADLLVDWATNTLTKQVTGLSPNSTYYFAVIVKDEAGNKSLYAPVSQKTADCSTETPGTICTSGSVFLGMLTQGASLGGIDKYMTTSGGCSEIPAEQIIGSGISAYSSGDFTPTCSGNDALLKSWNDSSATTFDILSLNNSAAYTNLDPNYGSTNTSNIVAITDLAQGGYHAAARYCDNLNFGGYTDWYLPNLTELGLFYTNRASIPGLVISGTNYWSSTEVSAANAWVRKFTIAGTRTSTAKNSAATLVRCVRRYSDTPIIAGALTFSAIEQTSIKVNWNAASDATTPQSALQYKLVKAAASANIDTVSEADAIAGADLLMDWNTNTLTKTITSLTPSTNYYFALLTKDADNNKALYFPVLQPTCATGTSITGNCVIPSTVSTLSSITLSAGTISPVFASSIPAYMTNVLNNVVSISVTPTLTDLTASMQIRFNDGAWETVSSGQTHSFPSLDVGVNKIEIKVFAQETATNQTYMLLVTRGHPDDYYSANIGSLRVIPAGTFQRDATVTNLSTVSSFRISEKLITRDQFVTVTGLADPSQTNRSLGTIDPVQNVNWYHALVFCNKLSILEGLTPVYTISGSTDPAAWITANSGIVPITSNPTWNAVTANWTASGYRLPTEMEWMWAAMGGTPYETTGYTKAFAGSTGTNAINDYAWTSANSTITTHPVGTKLANELGLYDMNGNVSEWNWDWYAAYPGGSQSDYKGAAPAANRILHGGNFGEAASTTAIATRGFWMPYGQVQGFGFRVAKNL